MRLLILATLLLLLTGCGLLCLFEDCGGDLEVTINHTYVFNSDIDGTKEFYWSLDNVNWNSFHANEETLQITNLSFTGFSDGYSQSHDFIYLKMIQPSGVKTKKAPLSWEKIYCESICDENDQKTILSGFNAYATISF